MSPVLSVLTRTTRALFACWVALVLAQPVSVRTCPMNGGVLREVAHGPVMQHGAGHHASMHHMVATDLAPHDGAPNHDHDRSQCNCVGDCTAMVAFALPSFGVTVPAPRAVIERRPPVRVETPAAAEPRYLLPPSTAPPCARV